MKIFKKDGKPQPTKLERRVSSFGTYDLVIWVETSLAHIHKNVAGVGMKRLEQYDDALLEAEALVVIIKELQKRATDE
jgi:hypothetical protein